MKRARKGDCGGRRPPQIDAGFTLLELIIAIGITAAVMAAVGTILVSTLDADQHVTDILVTEKAGYGVLTLMRRDLEACYTYALGGPAFQGQRGTAAAQADGLAFVTAVEGDPDPKTGVRAKLQRIAYKLQQDPATGSLSLLRAADPIVSSKDDPLGASTFALVASGLKSLKFSYLDPKDKTWHDSEWKEQDRVPLAVRIAVELVPPSVQQQTGSQQSFNAPATSFQTTVGITAVFTPAPDQDPNAPPK